MAEQRAWRDGPWYWVTVAALILATAALVSYELWMRQSISNQFSDRSIYEFGTVKLNCSNEHFWGQEIYDTPHGKNVVCRDWIGQKWIKRGTQ